ncbi:MAG TPA: lysophospholipase [Candidatus Borkfalkia excrementigallinarum]|uniref:Lysophospholipase n=1 Tax=Candidatus Borkfalkia excrementigallinarum TaxID=2838506 RepID=A0A9D1ZVN3_9FIRM|nr:lysophospholipase [Candidatus Borkfalkia excrementigallinarum]
MISALIILFCILLAFFLIMFVLSLKVQFSIYNKRYDGNKNLRYFSAGDFQGLLAESIEFSSDKGQTLRGYLYRDANTKSPKALIIFSHGYGAGHTAYTTELNYFVRAGFWVLAYDGTGCVLSEGRNLKGFDQGVIDLRYAIRYVNKEPRFAPLKKILVGHSWGGFSVMNAVGEDGIGGAVAICGFISGAKVLAQNSIGRKIPALTFAVEWFLKLFARISFGKNANQNSIRSLQATEKPIFLLYGSEDRTVSFPKNGEVMKKTFQSSDHVKILICKGKAHNPYLSMSAEKTMKETFSQIAKMKKKDSVAAKILYEAIDYSKITEEDPEIMREIVSFIDGVIQKK